MHRLVVAVISLAALAGCSSRTPSPTEFALCEGSGLLNVGDPIPDCRFEGLAGHEDISLRALAGTPVVLNFWAGWCPSCIKEMPEFDAVATSLGDSVQFVGLDLLGVQGESKNAAVALAERTGVGYRLGYDRGGYLYGHFSGRRAAPVLPATIFIDAEGLVTHLRFGELDRAELEALIETHLGVTT